jgi:hypothetical protein
MLTGNDRGFGMFNSSSRSDMVNKSDESLNSHIGAAKTPQYIIKAEGDTFTELFSSDLEDPAEVQNAAPILWIETGGARLSTVDSCGELSGDGKIVAKDPIVCMKYGGWAPEIQNAMYLGKNIDKLFIMRVISKESTLVVIQELKHEKCFIKTYEQAGDTITFSFCYAILTDTSKAISHDDAVPTGNIAFCFDFTTSRLGEVK